MNNPPLSPARTRQFRRRVYRYFSDHGRSLPWRRRLNPYRVLVSEIMLQQTQVSRVAEKYGPFLVRFPDFKVLAAALLSDVLREWQGLGYNRRARSLHRAARIVVEEFGGRLPRDIAHLARLPGIGPATANSIAAFAFNAPVVFVETNIRAVFIHVFFRGRDGVRDDEIVPLVEQTLDRDNPRKWYSALMDYGVELKRTHGNPSRRSAHHHVQSPFEGSDRQVRGRILRTLLAHRKASCAMLHKETGCEPERLRRILRDLVREGMLIREKRSYTIDRKHGP